MNMAQFFINKRVISWLFIVVLLIGGALSFQNLGRLEDPAFTVKDAMVIGIYPGATALEVEEELTYPLEKAIRQLPYVDKVTSNSSKGKTQIMVSMGMQYGPDELPQIWDEMRRKINDLEPSLPSGLQSLQVYDDFGDVYGLSLMLTGKTYDYIELKRFADYLVRELELVDGVGKVNISGSQSEQIFVEVSTERLSTFNIDLNSVLGLLTQQNAVQSAGAVMISGESLTIRPTGTLTSIEELGELVIHGRDTGKLIRLKDVATLSRGIAEKPSHQLLFNGLPALNIGISYAAEVNVVEVGKRIDARLAELEKDTPLGMQLDTFYDQGAEVEQSVNGFLISLAEAVGIVIVVLLFVMGWRSGLIIGLVLLLTVMGTFILMDNHGIELHRISLGALIIALGMLVDNAIVVVEGIQSGMKRGLSKMNAAIAIVKQTQWPLLGATVIAITAFAPIGLSQDATGEFMGSLFWVLLYSLFLSWVTALTITPFLAELFLKEVDSVDGEIEEPYQGFVFTLFRKSLVLALRFRWLSIIMLVALMGSAVVGFKEVKQQFFPISNTPIFFVNVWMPQGTDIRETSEQVSEIEAFVREQQEVDYVATTIGQGMQRYMLTYNSEKSYESYAQLLVRANDLDSLFTLVERFYHQLPVEYPMANFRIQVGEFGPSPASKIEARIVGPDTHTLRSIATDIEKIIAADPGARNVKNNWQERTKTLVPQFNESKARRLGVSKQDFSKTLNMAFGGSTMGSFRDGTKQLPIVVRLPEAERLDVNTLELLKIWSPTMQSYVPLTQVMDDITLQWEEPLIMRRDRKREITVLADHDILSSETPAVLFDRIRPAVEAYPMPIGYELQWGGEYESQNDAREALASAMPLGYAIMFIITMLLFNSVRQPLVIWLTVPLAIIGVSFGLLGTSMPFSFTALLGLLSLSGMILKNGIVLMDQINMDLSSGKAPYDAVLDSATSRVLPVSMAAITTILGMLPLIVDPFFGSLAVTIMAGLGFATVLTLIVVPLLYATFYNVKA
ncbi:efflux RND transporter permease subunit [Vibrio ulleungensis]|uniref:Efflux RND transporter permease subunit n=1 Tax=Vibrio ulleungensis TaxID=2807619 RepID=A0ABS2HED5_9VIBR|nr:efflux RND transporter permease subunit [Vibrio ulleungensis]MBM7035940.1 efflux RND transporter permease subunit [Vibrio ulleungensis]